MKERVIFHIDVNNAFLSWTAVLLLKKGYKRRELDGVYEGISSRTITRKISDVEKTNPDLVDLYREVSKYRKKQMELPSNLKAEIDKLEEKEIFICGVCDKKREELLEKEKQYNDAMINGMGVIEASKKVGQNRVSKAINTLNRIEIERLNKLKESRNKEETEREI